MILRSCVGVVLFALMASLVAVTPAAEPATVDLNRASAEQLQQLPGVGPAIAKRIVDFRDEHGPIERVDDLLKVRGIGEKSLEKLRRFVTVEKKS